MDARTITTIDRRAGLGASDAPAAVGLSRWKSPYALWQEKLGLVPGIESSLPMRCGQALEPVVLEAFERDSGLKVTGQQSRFVDAALPWRWATPDGLVDTVTGRALVEAKTSSNPDEWGDGEAQIPIEYAIQVQHQLAVTGLALCYLPVLIATRELRVYRIERDEELIGLITERECEFWRLVESQTAPEPTSLDDLRARFPKDNGAARVAAPEVLAALLDYRRARLEAEAAEARAEEAKRSVVAALGEAASLVDESGRVLCTYKSAKGSRRFDVDAFRAANPQLHAEFLRETPGSRRFLVKEISA